jgi:hypothetical protein
MPTDLEKLRILLPHWIDHNKEHAAEFRSWAARASGATQEILAAAERLERADADLDAALIKLGGPLPAAHHHP